MTDLEKKGHRERLKNRFLNKESDSITDEALLELLLTYAIPLKDVYPLAKNLIAKFGNLERVLSASSKDLCNSEGIKTHTAALIKLIDWIRHHYIPRISSEELKISHESPSPEKKQEMLFKADKIEAQSLSPSKSPELAPEKSKIPRRGTGLFGKAVLKETIDLLPKLPDTESVEEIRSFLKQNLHFNAEQTRHRFADYVVYRMFNNGKADKPLLLFAKQYKNRQELRDACFYRFCKVESIMYRIIEDMIIPSIGKGSLSRNELRNYLQIRFPSSKSIIDYAKAIIDALTGSRLAKSTRTEISFSYREALLPSFAFILHSEFSEPAMYDISKLETNTAIRSMLWNPDRIIPALYELRNMGIIAKISEIDNIRQFTTKWTLSQIVDILCKSEKTR